MDKIYMQNFGMIVTNRCNLDCAHCMRGCKNNKDMSYEVIKKSLDQFVAIGNLAICGGEPTLALAVLEKIINYIVDNHILLEQFTVVINGTNYVDEFMKLLEYIDNYISYFKFKGNGKQTMFNISYDKYHMSEIERLNLKERYYANLRKFKESKFFGEINYLPDNVILFREGNAANLPKESTEELKETPIVVTYPGKSNLFKKKGLCNIGPLMTVNVDGIITECDASLESQDGKFNFGNVFDNTFEEIALKRGKIIKPRCWNRETSSAMSKFLLKKK